MIVSKGKLRLGPRSWQGLGRLDGRRWRRIPFLVGPASFKEPLQIGHRALASAGRVVVLVMMVAVAMMVMGASGILAGNSVLAASLAEQARAPLLRQVRLGRRRRPLVLPRENKAWIDRMPGGVLLGRSLALGIRVIRIAAGSHGLRIVVGCCAARRTRFARHGDGAGPGSQHPLPMIRPASQPVVCGGRSLKTAVGRCRAVGQRLLIARRAGLVVG